jgi:ATP-dependent helicase/nuclease subunit A
VSSRTIRIVNASAGTGKTYRLSTEVRDAVLKGMPPEHILATTFTNRAAAELLERGRERLLEHGRAEEALRLMLARIGTVNGVFGRMLGEFALEQGRSPVAAVVPEGAQARLFRIAADGVIGRHAPVLAALADRFGFAEGQAATQTDWQKLLADLVGAARLNGLGRTALAASAERSWQTLRSVLPPPEKTAGALDAALAEAVETALSALGEGDGTKTTGAALSTLEEARRILSRPISVPWSVWARLAKVTTAKALDGVVAPVRDAASAHPRHPRLHEDLETFIRTIFAAAGEALEEAQAFKRRRGFVDFVDQEAETLSLLDDPTVAARIAAGTELLLVDEFQDTSPIQLALFMRLASLVPDTLFVGDPKQAIYGFRGADPELVAAVADAIARETGTSPGKLALNRRSRPGLVTLANAVFSTALPPLGIPAEQVTVSAHRQDVAGQRDPVALWRVAGSRAETAAAALAGRVARLLKERDAWQVAPRSEQGRTRSLAGGDIAILALTNRDAERLAGALAARGLKVALERDGLLTRAECAVALAGLRVLADASDTLAIAEILHILEGDAERPAWLEAALAADKPGDAIRAREPIPALVAARDGIAGLTPAEVLDRAIDRLDLSAWLPRWGDAAARHANLAALRALAREYEEECRRERLPGSAAGLAAWFGSQDKVQQPASPDPEAIQVMTVHRAKGMEWPFVVLADLEEDDEPRLFNSVVPMAADGGIDPAVPLAGRWVRLWPWPYGGQKKDVYLDTSASDGAVGQAAQYSLRQEKARLLYVALTRARDYLVLAPRVNVSAKGERTLKTGWLDLFPGALELPTSDGGRILAGGTPVPASLEDVDASEEAGGQTVEMAPLLASLAVPSFAPRRLRPSAAVKDGAVTFTVERIGPRLPLAGHADMRLVGEAVHGFLAADRPSASRAWRESLARRLLDAWQVTALAPQDLVSAADRFWSHITSAYPGAELRHEWTVLQVAGGSITSGRADLVVEYADGLALYDHKTFAGDETRWEYEMRGYVPQLEAYAGALFAATGRTVRRRAVHLPSAGAILILGGDD